MQLVLIRHGQTPGNAAHQYVGALDQPLSEKGRAQAAAAGVHPDVSLVYVSTMRRARETAQIMFPNARFVEVDGVQEMDFGDFAGRSANEMADDAAYCAWVDSYCTLPCPNGESRDEFTDRVCDALEALLRAADARGEQRVVLVAHGGTMMAALSRRGRPEREYWNWQLPCGCGWMLDYDPDEDCLRVLREVSFLR